MKKIIIATYLLLCMSNINLAQNDSSKVIFKNDFKECDVHEGLKYRISEPYLGYAKSDVNQLFGEKMIFELELINKSDKFISAIVGSYKIFDKSGKQIKAMSGGFSIALFEPKPIDYRVIDPGYKGVYKDGIVLKSSILDIFGKIEFTIYKVETASKSLQSKPIYTQDSIVFKENTGLELRVSQPYWFLDTDSGLEYFAIALKVKNTSSKPIRRLKINYKIVGKNNVINETKDFLLGGNFEPYVSSFAPPFAANSERYNLRFFMSENTSLFWEFEKVEISLVEIE